MFFLGAIVKSKIELLLKVLSFHLQLKFLAIALASLVINLARFWIDLKKQPKVRKFRRLPEKAVLGIFQLTIFNSFHFLAAKSTKIRILIPTTKGGSHWTCAASGVYHFYLFSETYVIFAQLLMHISSYL